MTYCLWERAECPSEQFKPYRGAILLHTTADPVHLTSGELPDGIVDRSDAIKFRGPRGRADLPAKARDRDPT